MKRALIVLGVIVLAALASFLWVWLSPPEVPCGSILQDAKAEFGRASLSQTQVSEGHAILEQENAILCTQLSQAGFPVSREVYLFALFSSASNEAETRNDPKITLEFARLSIMYYKQRPRGEVIPESAQGFIPTEDAPGQ